MLTWGEDPEDIEKAVTFYGCEQEKMFPQAFEVYFPCFFNDQ